MHQIAFTSLIFKEGATFVSYCPELGVASCGDTVEEARRRLPEAVRLFLEESQRMGTLQDILCEEGFVPSDPTGERWAPPHRSSRPSRCSWCSDARRPRCRASLRSRTNVSAESLSWVRAGSSGRRSRVYTKPGISRPIVIPCYHAVPVFIILNNLRTAGISRDEYFSLLEKA